MVAGHAADVGVPREGWHAVLGANSVGLVEGPALDGVRLIERGRGGRRDWRAYCPGRGVDGRGADKPCNGLRFGLLRRSSLRKAANNNGEWKYVAIVAIHTSKRDHSTRPSRLPKSP